MTLLRRFLARRRLQRMVNANCRSFHVQDYRRRRNAAKLGWARRAR